MAENLNFATESSSWCYEEKEANCTTYGKLYDWETALTVCPTGWHLPSEAEWTTLENYVGGRDIAGTKLKSNDGWNNSGNGTDDYGFSALSGGYRRGVGTFVYIDKFSGWWSATDNAENKSYAWYLRYDYTKVDSYYDGKDYGLYVRCLRD